MAPEVTFDADSATAMSWLLERAEASLPVFRDTVRALFPGSLPGEVQTAGPGRDTTLLVSEPDDAPAKPLPAIDMRQLIAEAAERRPGPADLFFSGL